VASPADLSIAGRFPTPGGAVDSKLRHRVVIIRPRCRDGVASALGMTPLSAARLAMEPLRLERLEKLASLLPSGVAPHAQSVRKC